MGRLKPVEYNPQVVEEASPLPPADEFSAEFRDFVGQCLMKDPARRPTAEQLLHHPYILKVGAKPRLSPDIFALASENDTSVVVL